MRYYCCLAVFLLLFASCKTHSSFLRVEDICHPDAKYDGNIVIVKGILSIKFEDNSLISELQKDNNKPHSVLWVEVYLPAGDWNEVEYNNYLSHERALKRLSGQVVTLRGKINSSNKGHLGMFCGAIENPEIIHE